MPTQHPSRAQTARSTSSSPERKMASSDEVARNIMRGLYEGRFAEGQRLIESDLITRFGVSRSTVRESLKKLEADGVVICHQFRGAEIRSFTRDDARNVLLILELLVGLAARQAAEHIADPGAKAAFEAAYAHLMKYEGSPDSYELVRARNQFYRAITKIGGNTELERLLPKIQVHLIRVQVRLPQSRRFSDYRQIAKAILSGAPPKAETAARAHIRRTGQELMKQSR